MSLVRSFTSLRNRYEPDSNSSIFHIGRTSSQRGGRSFDRGLISSPLALISTSNVALDKARPIAGTTPVDVLHSSSRSSASSKRSHESDRSSLSGEHLTDASSLDESHGPRDPNWSPSGSYTKVPYTHSTKESFGQSLSSHDLSKRAFSGSRDPLNSQHETNSLMSPFPDFADDTSYLSSQVSHTAPAPSVEAPLDAPFGAELAQLDLVAEEYGSFSRDAQTMDDIAAIRSKNLACFTASDYLREINSLIDEMRNPYYQEPAVCWI